MQPSDEGPAMNSPPLLYDEDGTAAALGTFDTVIVECWLNIEGTPVEVPASTLPHPLEIVDSDGMNGGDGCVKRKIGGKEIAWDLASSKATEELCIADTRIPVWAITGAIAAGGPPSAIADTYNLDIERVNDVLGFARRWRLFPDAPGGSASNT